VAEVAAELACSEPTVRRRIRDGTLPAVQPGGAGHSVRVPRVALYRYLTGGPPVELRNAHNERETDR
jgi:excisionase family DNA binding protein